MNAPQAFIFHHTGGRGTVGGVQSTLQQRGLGVQYIMDRDGNITTVSPNPGLSQIRPGSGVGAGLSNANTVGMEVIAKDNKDVTPAQVAAAQRFIQQNYPNTPVYGHGEVNPGHKEPDEGMAIVGAIRQGRGQPIQPTPFAPQQPALGFAPPAAQTPQMAGQPLPLFPSSSARGDPTLATTTGQVADQQQQPQGFSVFGMPMNQTDLANFWARQNPLG